MRIPRCDLCHIDLDQVSVRRGGQLLLQDVSMHIHCGQLTVLIGQNGAGKTTLIRALLGEIPHGGSIRHVDSAGRDLAHLTTGYVPQHLSFDPEMPLTVQDFLASSMTRRPVWAGVGKKVRAQVLQALQDVSAGDLADRPLGRCSGGELQRVLLALALHPAPDLLVLDEPVSGMDRNGLKLFLDTVTHLKETRHIAILLVSHDLRLVREYADHVILLEKNVLAQGSPREVFASDAFEAVFGSGEAPESEPDVFFPKPAADPILPAPGHPPIRRDRGSGHAETGAHAEVPSAVPVRKDVSASRFVRLSSAGRREAVRDEAPASDSAGGLSDGAGSGEVGRRSAFPDSLSPSASDVSGAGVIRNSSSDDKEARA